MPKRRSSEQEVTVDLACVKVKSPRNLTDDEKRKLAEYIREEAQYAAERWAEAELDEEGCWCYGLDHKRECKHWVLPR